MDAKRAHHLELVTDHVGEALHAEPDAIRCGKTVRQPDIAGATAVGEERFHILNSASSHPYLSAVVESTPLQSHLSLDVVRGTQLLRRQVTSYLSILTSLAEINQETQPLDLDLDLDAPSAPMPR